MANCIILTWQEKKKCLEEILKRVKKILYVYEKTLENKEYDYKIFVTGLLFYVYSSDKLFEGGLTNIIINLNTILINDFDKNQLKKIVFETKNMLEYMLREIKEE